MPSVAPWLPSARVHVIAAAQGTWGAERGWGGVEHDTRGRARAFVWGKAHMLGSSVPPWPPWSRHPRGRMQKRGRRRDSHTLAGSTPKHTNTHHTHSRTTMPGRWHPVTPPARQRQRRHWAGGGRPRIGEAQRRALGVFSGLLLARAEGGGRSDGPMARSRQWRGALNTPVSLRGGRARVGRASERVRAGASVARLSIFHLGAI